jgi:hypothetical protein
MFERSKKPIISKAAFLRRMLGWGLLTFFLIGLSLLVGMLGYHYFEGLTWLDSLLNAAMILGGMGPVDILKTEAGKLFASFYALYCGLFFIICGGLLLAPVFHRILHHFHSDK